MAQQTVTEMTARIEALLRVKLGAGGDTLTAQLRQCGRYLPRPVRRAAQKLAAASTLAQHPKVMVRMDPQKLRREYDICLRHLSPLPRGSLRRQKLSSLAASIGFGLLVVGLGFIAYLLWRGHV